MANHDYLQRFKNLGDVATSYNGQLHDQVIVDIVTERLHPGVPCKALSDAQKLVVQTASSNLYLATMFIHQSDRRWYGKLSEELENSFTKGNDNYPNNLVSTYHLINEYKCWQPKSATPDSFGVAFAPKGNGKVDQKNNDGSWQKKATCHHCGKIGHIRPNCPVCWKTMKTRRPTTTSPTLRQSPPRTPRMRRRKRKKPLSLSQLPSPKTKASPRTNFSIFRFCTTPISAPMNLRDMILLDNQSTVDLFCNRKLVSRVWKTDESMTVHGNGGTISTKMKAHITNYGDVWFDTKAITNILSLKNVREKCHVTYDSHKEGSFIVHKPNGINIHFDMHAGGLHYHDTNNCQLTMVSTVKSESVGFSKTQLE
jgi:hypothetical protein